MLLCWHGLTMLHTRQDWEKGEHTSVIIFISQWIPCSILVCKGPYRCFQWKMSVTEMRNSLLILRKKDVIYQIWKKRSLLWKSFGLLLRTRTTASGLNRNSGQMKQNCSKASPDADIATKFHRRYFFSFWEVLKQWLCLLLENGTALTKVPIFW